MGLQVCKAEIAIPGSAQSTALARQAAPRQLGTRKREGHQGPPHTASLERRHSLESFQSTVGSRSGLRQVVNCCFREHKGPEACPLGLLGPLHRKENLWWLRSPENLPTRKRARRENNTAMSVKKAWTSLSILDATETAGTGSRPAGEKTRPVGVRAGRARTATLWHSPLACPLERRTATILFTVELQAGKGSILSGQGNSQRSGAHTSQKAVVDKAKISSPHHVEAVVVS